jgi:hypothetical protein
MPVPEDGEGIDPEGETPVPMEGTITEEAEDSAGETSELVGT